MSILVRNVTKSFGNFVAVKKGDIKTAYVDDRQQAQEEED